jgi:signal transduction histidine kinase
MASKESLVGWWRSHVRSWSVPELVADAGLATVVAVVVAIAIRVASEPDSRPPDPFAYLLAVIIGAVLLARHQWPFAVLIVTVLTLLVYYSFRYPGVSPALPLAAALYTASAAGRFRWSLLVAAFFVCAGLFVRGFREQAPLFPLMISTVQDAALLGATVLLGETVRSRRLRLAEAQDRLRRAETEREREAARRVAEERLRIARELHDILAHTISAISVQAGLALDVLDDSPAQARTALGTIRAASRAAMTELKATVGMLRASDDASAPRSPPPGLDQLDQLFAMVRDAGLRVDVAVTGEARPLPAAVDRAAYRIVQESLTNVVRHAGASCVSVAISYERAALTIRIADNGRGPASGQPASPGHGLVGMTERAVMLGGWLETGSRPGRGFLVQAQLPTEEASA